MTFHSGLPEELTVGSQVAERFEILRSHRQGGLSVAFEVRDLADDSLCELQFFPPSLFDGERQVQSFAAAWEPWKRVRSPHVLRVREMVSAGPSSLFLITDLPQGVQLRTFLKQRGRLAPEEVVRLGSQLLEGLAEIHGHGLVHGDVKPLTVFLGSGESDPGSEAVLVDGGTTHGLWTAKELGERTALIGTPYYAPVEQFGGDAPDVRSDVYNLATVLYECATGVLPWTGASFLEVFQSKLQDPPPMRKRAPDLHLDPALESAIVRGCLADRHKRYPSAREFQQALAAVKV
jgi:serine/threonine protein kinase